MAAALNDGPSASGREEVDKSGPRPVPRLLSALPEESVLNTGLQSKLEIAQTNDVQQEKGGGESGETECEEGSSAGPSWTNTIMAGIAGGLGVQSALCAMGHLARGGPIGSLLVDVAMAGIMGFIAYRRFTDKAE